MLSCSALLTLGLLATPPGPSGEPTRPGRSTSTEVASGHLDRRGPALEFDEAVGASAEAPALQRLDAAVEDKRRADAELPRLTQNPQLQVMPGGRLPPASDPGFELQTTLTQGWNLEGYGRERKKAARAETEVLAAEARALAMERRLGAARAWIRLHAAEQRLALAEQELAIAEELGVVLDRARAAGVATRVDVAEAQALAAEAQALVTALAGEVHDLGLVLGRETGERVSVPLRTRGPYPDPPLPPEAELRRRFDDLGALPEVALRRLRARAALARADESAAAGGTRLTTGLSVQRESNRDVLLYGVVGVTIPLVDRNQREQATARAEARRHEAEAELHEVELSARLQVALHDLHHTELQMATLRDQTIPALDELVLARDLALEQGEGTRALLLQTRRRRHEAARALARAEGEWILARVQVWLYLEAFASAEGPR